MSNTIEALKRAFENGGIKEVHSLINQEQVKLNNSEERSTEALPKSAPVDKPNLDELLQRISEAARFRGYY